jgi:hypothetical protein
LVAAFLANHVTPRTAGLVASAVAAKARADGDAAKAAAPRAVSAHFGTIGKRDMFTFTVLRAIDGVSEFGHWRIHVLRDDAGNIARWKSSGACFDAGERVTGKATVKAHTDYQGTAQTELSRCAFQRIAPGTGSGTTPARPVPPGYAKGE